MSSVKVGNAEIVALLDIPVDFPLSVVFGGVPAASWAPYELLYPRSISNGQLHTNFQAFVIRSAAGNVLVDTGAGPGPIEMLGGARGNLLNDARDKGIDFASIQTVIFTHLHFDHTGWANANGTPLCPNARYLAPEADWANLGNSAGGYIDEAALKPLRDSGKLELVSGEKQVTAEVTIIPTPGHTPGHQSIVVASAGERGFIAGDIAATPAVLQETEWTFGFDGDPPTAIATRKRVVERLEADGSIAAFGHFPHPGFGRLVREGNRRIFKAL